MRKIIKYILPHKISVFFIVLLLILQASCNLALPEYTAKIIDTGIQNRGVEHILPLKMPKEEYDYAQLFMTKEEASAFTDSYKKSGEYYELVVNDQDTLSQLDQQLLVPILLNYNMSALPVENFKSLIKAENPEITNNEIKILEEHLETFTKNTENQQGETTKVECFDARPIFKQLKTGLAVPNSNKEVTLVKITDKQLLALRNNLEQELEAVGFDLLKSYGIAYAISCNQKSEVDLNALQTNYLWATGLTMLLFAIVQTMASIGVGFFASRVGAKTGMNLRSTVFSKVVSFSNKEIDNFSTASLITRSTNDVQQIQMVITMLLRMILFAPIISIGSIIKVLNTGANMGWVIVLAVLTIAGAVGVMMAVAMPKFKLMQKLVDNVNLIAREILTGIPVIRAFKREEHEEKRFDKANTNLTKTTLFTNRVMTFMAPVMMLVMNGTSVLIVWVASGHIDQGTMQVGEMTAFINYSMHIVISFLMLTMMSIMLPRAIVSAERIEEVINTNSSIIDPDNPENFNISKGVVSFNNVSFKYPNADDNVLENLSFQANSGETTAIIGSTGSGKSTLVNLIPRLYDVTEGSITIDGYNIKNISMKDLRDAIGYVPQKGILFSGTIASNIKYGNKNASDEEMKNSAEIAQAVEFIDEKPLGYNSEISQGGTNVSGGQKQRLSIARAIAKNPKIYIFDDSFSALDMKTDAMLREALKTKTQDSTVIIVAQRISTIINAEKIIVLDDGKIAGIGTHKELLKSCEAYLEIAKSQLSPKELGLQEVLKNE